MPILSAYRIGGVYKDFYTIFGGIHFGVGAFPLYCYNTIECEMFQEISAKICR